MMLRGQTFLFILVFLNYGKCEFKQERARVVFVKPEFAKDYSILTIREGRNAPYLTTLKFTTLQPINNNVTFRFEFANDKTSAYPLRIEHKACDLIAQKWVQDWFKAYSNIHTTNCPIPTGVYEIRKFEMPPKNFPLDFSNMDYVGKTIVFMTSTKQKLAELHMELKSNHKKG